MTLHRLGSMSQLKVRVKYALHLAPHALSMVIIAAHASVITEVVRHVSVKQLLLAGIMFAIWYTSRSGTVDEL